MSDIVASEEESSTIAVTSPSLYERLGGTSSDPGLVKFLDRLWDLIDSSREIGDFFALTRLSFVRQCQRDFFVSILKGDVDSSESAFGDDSRTLREIHSHVRIKDSDFNCLLLIIEKAALDEGASPQLVVEVVEEFAAFRSQIVNIVERVKRTQTIRKLSPRSMLAKRATGQ